MSKIVTASLVFTILVRPPVIEAQTESGWFVGSCAGRYEIHTGPDNTGAALGVFGGHRSGPMAFQLSLVHGFGAGGFTALEPGSRCKFLRRLPFN